VRASLIGRYNAGGLAADNSLIMSSVLFSRHLSGCGRPPARQTVSLHTVPRPEDVSSTPRRGADIMEAIFCSPAKYKTDMKARLESV